MGKPEYKPTARGAIKSWAVLEHRSRGRVPLISHPYDDSSAAYLGTAILTVACFLHLLMSEPYVR
jgi:hypothetical protein